MDSDKISEIVKELARQGVNVKSEDIMKIAKGNTKGAIAQMVQNNSDMSKDLTLQNTKNDIVEQRQNDDDAQKSLFGDGFKYKTGGGGVVAFQRATQYSKQVSDKKLDALLEQHKDLQDLSDQIHKLEMETPQSDRDEAFVVVNEDLEKNWLKTVQDSISNWDAYNRKYLVTSKMRKNDEPSMDLTTKLI